MHALLALTQVSYSDCTAGFTAHEQVGVESTMCGSNVCMQALAEEDPALGAELRLSKDTAAKVRPAAEGLHHCVVSTLYSTCNRRTCWHLAGPKAP